jgi:hypothetical protein
MAMEDEFLALVDLDQKALEDHFRSLQCRAIAAGWTLDEIAGAMWALGQSSVKGQQIRH